MFNDVNNISMITNSFQVVSCDDAESVADKI